MLPVPHADVIQRPSHGQGRRRSAAGHGRRAAHGLRRPTWVPAYHTDMPAPLPIPPIPLDPQAPLGAETGHSGGDGPYPISSGPYMIEGSASLDFALPPARQASVSGFRPRRSLTLV